MSQLGKGEGAFIGYPGGWLPQAERRSSGLRARRLRLPPGMRARQSKSKHRDVLNGAACGADGCVSTEVPHG